VKRNTGMFQPWWFDLDGSKLEPLRGRAIAEAHRLWRDHQDVRKQPRENASLRNGDVAELFGLNGAVRPQKAVSRVPAATAYLDYQQLRLTG
jgi:hypothetical protein